MEGGLWTIGIRKDGSSEHPLVSIIMVTWNAEKHFRQALESVLGQSYSNREVIIIDGGSSDSTLSIIKEYEDRIDYWISEPDKGIYDAMNKGILLARGDWIGFKNADDWFAPDALQLLIKNAREFPDTDLWYGNSYSVIQEKPLQVAPFFTNHQSLGRNPGVDHRCSFVRTALHKNTLFNLEYQLAADLDVFWRLQEQGCIFRHTGAFMAYKRFGGASDGTRILRESFRINTKYRGWLFAVTSTLESRIRFLIWKSGNSILRFLLGEKGFHEFKARRIRPSRKEN